MQAPREEKSQCPNLTAYIFSFSSSSCSEIIPRESNLNNIYFFFLFPIVPNHPLLMWKNIATIYILISVQSVGFRIIIFFHLCSNILFLWFVRTFLFEIKNCFHQQMLIINHRKIHRYHSKYILFLKDCCSSRKRNHSCFSDQSA